MPPPSPTHPPYPGCAAVACVALAAPAGVRRAGLSAPRRRRAATVLAARGAGVVQAASLVVLPPAPRRRFLPSRRVAHCAKRRVVAAAARPQVRRWVRPRKTPRVRVIRVIRVARPLDSLPAASLLLAHWWRPCPGPAPSRDQSQAAALTPARAGLPALRPFAAGPGAVRVGAGPGPVAGSESLCLATQNRRAGPAIQTSDLGRQPEARDNSQPAHGPGPASSVTGAVKGLRPAGPPVRCVVVCGGTRRSRCCCGT